MNRLKEIEERLSAIKAEIDTDGADLDALETEIQNLKEERKAIKDKAEKRKALLEDVANMPAVEVIKDFKVESEVRKMEFTIDNVLETTEYRSGFLKRLQGKVLNEVEQRALTTATNSSGAAVPITTLNMIIDKLRQVSVLFPLINVTYIPGNLSLVVANAKNASSWKTEGADGVAADDTVVTVNLAGYELIKLVEISAAASAMTIDAFEAYIAAEIGRQMSIALENAILNGTGTGQPTGILSGITWTTGTNRIDWGAAAVGYDNIVDALALLPTMYHPDARFVMNRKVLFSGIRKLKDAQGQPLFTYNPQDRAAMTILGYPVVMDDYVPDDVILICSPQYYYMNFSKPVELSSDLSVGFKSGKVTYRGLAVVDGKPALAEAFVKLSKTGV
jgi:HK97 family phage major capsid protein